MSQKKSRKYAVVDLEATSAGSNARIIQVGIVIIENHHIIKTYETDVNPHESLDDHIVDLTGLTDERLAKAPDFSQVAREIFHLIEDCIFVAHNVKFDANLLAEELFFEGYELRTPRVDTVELTQVFFPSFEKYSLPNLAEVLDLDLQDAHTAIADAYATAQLFLKIREKMASLPKITLETILSFADHLLFESRLVLEEIFEEVPTQLPDHLLEVGGLVIQHSKQYRKSKYLSQDFLTNLALLDLEERAAQSQFAQLIEDGLGSFVPSFIEAQTGIGKTYGYLLPLLAKAEGQILVSVPTKLLQDQIMENEAKQLKEVFHINSHSVKSPRNYIKLDAFYHSLQRQDKNRLLNRFKMQILVWLVETKTGDLDEIRQKQRLESYFDELRHDGQVKRDSLFATVDFWERSDQLAKSSQVLITNHAYLLERMQDDIDFVKGKVLVVDEAQKFFLALENFSRRRLDITQTLQWLDKEAKHTANLLQKRLLERLQFNLSQASQAFYQKKEVSLSQNLLEVIRQDISEYPLRLEEDLWKIFLPYYSDYWFESEVDQEQRKTYLNAARLDLFRFQTFIPDLTKVYFVSATLEISKRVTLPDLLGIADYEAHRIESSKSSDQKIWVDTSMPNLVDLPDAIYEEEIARRLMALSQLEQPILVLFNSKQHMLAVSERLDTWMVKHLCQEKNGLAYNIKKRFDRGEANILLGTGGFWEGVDFVHQDQLIEVITRLPFENPEDRFVKKVNHYLRQNHKNPFYDYTLPVMTLKLKQAIGRTQRRDNQVSAVLILDKRVVSKSYGKQICQILEQNSSLSCKKFPDIVTEITSFF
ncbi:bifunctional DnaQ family exonuclease/ATP-dependent helicase [Streptococcus sp. SGI.013]|uniref:bifunctional DnaQ family exonuclease/ATP-dependent helicase n=1 Tax=unclassified Streptococcus TaxID=2608887 RepID=UPI003D04191C